MHNLACRNLRPAHDQTHAQQTFVMHRAFEHQTVIAKQLAVI